jgi:hypothetical protein
MARTDRLDEDIEQIIGSREEGNIGKCMKHYAYKRYILDFLRCPGAPQFHPDWLHKACMIGFFTADSPAHPSLSLLCTENHGQLILQR